MRFALPFVVSLSLVGAALAQTPGVTIEDDVSHGNAIACAGLRAAQEKKAPDALVSAAHAAWIKSRTKRRGLRRSARLLWQPRLRRARLSRSARASCVSADQ